MHVLSFWGSQTHRRGSGEAGPSTAAHSPAPRLAWIWPSLRLGKAASSGCWETFFSAENIPTIPARGHQTLLPLISCSDGVEKSAGHLPSQQVPDAHFLPSALSEGSGHRRWPQPDWSTSCHPLSPPFHNSAGASPLGIVLHWPLTPRIGPLPCYPSKQEFTWEEGQVQGGEKDRSMMSYQFAHPVSHKVCLASLGNWALGLYSYNLETCGYHLKTYGTSYKNVIVIVKFWLERYIHRIKIYFLK